MIKSIMIFKKNGLCLYYKNINSQFENPHQMSGFFSAINLFCNNTFNEEIQVLSTGNSSINFKNVKDNVFAIITDNIEYQEDDIDEVIDNFFMDFTSKKDEEFVNEGRIPEFHYFDTYLMKFEKVEAVQKCF